MQTYGRDSPPGIGWLKGNLVFLENTQIGQYSILYICEILKSKWPSTS